MFKKGFTLIELMIVILIIGIVAAIAIPNLLSALQKGKQKAAMADMRNIGAAIESYITDNNMAPGAGSASAADDLAPYLVPFHSRPLPARDPWGGMYHYQSGGIGLQQDFYSIICRGRDRNETGIDVDNSNYTVSTMEDFNKDICFSNGNFTYAPKVK